MTAPCSFWPVQNLLKFCHLKFTLELFTLNFYVIFTISSLIACLKYYGLIFDPNPLNSFFHSLKPKQPKIEKEEEDLDESFDESYDESNDENKSDESYDFDADIQEEMNAKKSTKDASPKLLPDRAHLKDLINFLKLDSREKQKILQINSFLKLYSESFPSKSKDIVCNFFLLFLAKIIHFKF